MCTLDAALSMISSRPTRLDSPAGVAIGQAWINQRVDCLNCQEVCCNE
jgi:hypothetical protein